MAVPCRRVLERSMSAPDTPTTGIADRAVPAQRGAATTVLQAMRRDRLALSAAAVGFVVLFWPALVELVSFWNEDPDFSHGFLIVPISAGILWANRKSIGQLETRRSAWGLALTLTSLLVFFAGHLTRTNVVQRAGLWGTLVGGTWFLYGSMLPRRHPFPFLFLLFMFPPPHQWLVAIRLHLKRLATQMSADSLPLFGVDALEQGNVLVVAGRQLEVADACSGVRSLMAIVATAALFAYLFRTGTPRGVLLILTAIPVTVVINVLRIVVVSVALVRADIDLTAGTPHEILGFAVFALSLVLLFASARFWAWLFRWRTKEPVP